MIFLFLSSPTIRNKIHRSDYKRWYPRVQIVFETVKRTDNVRNTPFKNKKILLFVLKPIKKTATKRCVPAERHNQEREFIGFDFVRLTGGDGGGSTTSVRKTDSSSSPLRIAFPALFPRKCDQLAENSGTSIQSLFSDEYKIPVKLIGGRPLLL